MAPLIGGGYKEVSAALGWMQKRTVENRHLLQFSSLAREMEDFLEECGEELGVPPVGLITPIDAYVQTPSQPHPHVAGFATSFHAWNFLSRLELPLTPGTSFHAWNFLSRLELPFTPGTSSHAWNFLSRLELIR